MHHHPLRTVVLDLQRYGRALELPLALLNAEAVAAYLAARFPQQQFPPALALWLHQRTDGQPLFLVTLVQALVERRVLYEHEEGWTAQEGLEPLTLGVPESLRQLLEHQITRLSPEAQRVLEVASVAGVEFVAAAVAASLEADQIQYLFGKRLREYSAEELGKFQVITDVMGGFSYAQDLTLFMQKTLGFLEPNGAFYTVLQDVRTETGTNKPYYPDASFLTEIVNTDGSEVRMCSWLKSISCVEVTCEAKPDWSPPLEVYRIRKTCDEVVVPALTPVHFEAGTPPERRFRLQ